MEKLKNVWEFVKNFVIIAYILLIIFVTICLLSFNEYKVTEFGKNTIIPIIDEDLEPDYTVGDLVIVEKGKLSRVDVGDVVFFYRTISGITTINYAKITKSEMVTDTEFTYTVEGDYKFSSSYFIGEAENATVIPKVGKVLSVLESKWGFLFLGVFPSLVAFLYTLHYVIVEVQENKEAEKKKKKKKKKKANSENIDKNKSEEPKDKTSDDEVKEMVKEIIKPEDTLEENKSEKVEEPIKIEIEENKNVVVEIEKEEKKEADEKVEIKPEKENVVSIVPEKDESKEELQEVTKEKIEEVKEEQTVEQKKKAMIEAKMKTMTEEEKRALIEAKLKSMTPEEKKALIEAKKKKLEAEKNKKGE